MVSSCSSFYPKALMPIKENNKPAHGPNGVMGCAITCAIVAIAIKLFLFIGA